MAYHQKTYAIYSVDEIQVVPLSFTIRQIVSRRDTRQVAIRR